MLEIDSKRHAKRAEKIRAFDEDESLRSREKDRPQTCKCTDKDGDEKQAAEIVVENMRVLGAHVFAINGGPDIADIGLEWTDQRGG